MQITISFWIIVFNYFLQILFYSHFFDRQEMKIFFMSKDNIFSGLFAKNN